MAPVSVVRYQISALGLAAGADVRKSPYDPQLVEIKSTTPAASMLSDR